MTPVAVDKTALRNSPRNGRRIVLLPDRVCLARSVDSAQIDVVGILWLAAQLEAGHSRADRSSDERSYGTKTLDGVRVT